jgi:acylglycerol lipase
MATVLAGHGIACFGIEHQGHGKSEGLKGYVPSFSGLVDDCLHWAAVIRERELPAGTPLFLYGESLGGGIALHAALKEPHALSGLVLFAPMTGLAEGLAPPWLVEQIGKLAAFCMPTAPLAPVKDLVDLCFKNEAMRPLARADPHRYSGGMRLGTAFQLKGAMEHLSAHAHELSTPFLLLHGTADRITSHHASERVFEACAAADKTLLLYEDAWHVLWCEATDSRRRMLADLTGWLAERCDPERRAAATLPIKVKATRPAGVEAFEGAHGEATTVFTLASHPHLYEGSSPQGAVERLDAAAAQAALRRPAPRMGTPATAAAIERAAAAATAGAAPLPPVESAAGDVSPAESIVDAAVKRVESMPAIATAAEAAAPS